MQVKLTFQKSTGSEIFKIDVLPAWELIFQPELSSHAGKTVILIFKKQGFHLLFFRVFLQFLVFLLDALGFLLASFWSLCRLFWRAGDILLGVFGLPGLSVGSLCYFLWCLWLAWAVCGLGDRSGPVFWFIFETCSMFFQLFFHLLAWSRPCRRRGRRPLQ